MLIPIVRTTYTGLRVTTATKKIKMMNRYLLLILFAFSCSVYGQDGIPNLPILDISGQKERQVVVAAGTEKIYNGHVNTTLLPDNKTIYAFWTISHGGACGPVAESKDGGYTWKRIDERMPDTYSGWHYICPSVFRLNRPGR